MQGCVCVEGGMQWENAHLCRFQQNREMLISGRVCVCVCQALCSDMVDVPLMMSADTGRK